MVRISWSYRNKATISDTVVADLREAFDVCSEDGEINSQSRERLSGSCNSRAIRRTFIVCN